MDRTEWSVAWRYARRITRRGRLAELEALGQARQELGRALPLRASAAALQCLWTRREERDELYALRAHRREWEFCRYS